ncbi:MAG TPA: sulfotransferase [Bradyrhizobium sp.]|uniref:tetratricopeptide repeat-containing sulfotransferase family protein n=1 Tax=Bradyrhizobium sp. TaxID=376 RepID=UPI002D80693E|nr:sulfotransferase [Bradyrhizobium sp.]HET7885005.1 sulfotransferase [Bradyrhizobium sp.]
MKPAPQHNPAPTIDAARRAFRSGDVGATERICAEILARSAGDAAAWQLLTETALQRGRHDAAMVSADRAVALAPQDPIAHVLQAKCLFFGGETAKALAAAEAAASRAGAADALDAVGAMFGLLGLHAQAKGLFARAVAIKTDEPQYLFNLAATERMTGALADAESHCDAAIAFQKQYALAHYLRSDLRIQTAANNHVDEMEALLRDGGLSGPDEVLLRFALGKECEDLERYDRAYDHIAAGCQLQHALLRVDPARALAEIDQIMGAHNRDWIKSAPAGYASAAPVFVAGLPRTGTTLIERIIASHPAMRSVGETSAFANVMQRAMADRSAKADPAMIGRRYIENASALRVPPATRFVDKTLDNYLYCGLIHTALPNAKIILVRRHPLDACWAMLKAHFRGKFLFSYDQVEVADYYLAFRRLARHWKVTLSPDVLMEIDYEEVVRDQSGTSRRMIDFVGLDWDDEVLRFHASQVPSATASAVQVRRPIYTSSIGKWRHHADRLGPLRQRLVREIPESELQ